VIKEWVVLYSETDIGSTNHSMMTISVDKWD